MAAGGFVLGLIAVLFAQHATAQTVHIVGDSAGWSVPQNPGFYTEWAANKSFFVGDSLTFNFQTNAHDVLEVSSKDSLDRCRFDTADDDIIRTGPATVRLNETGTHFFLCTVGPHCTLGQRLSINVSAATGGAGGPMSPSSPRPPSSLPTPSPSSSNAVMASLYITLSAIVMSLF